MSKRWVLSLNIHYLTLFFQFQMDEMSGDRAALVGKSKSGKSKKREPGMENPLYGSS